MDNLYQVQAVSPELAQLMRKAKTIYALCGGEVVDDKNVKDFYGKKAFIMHKIKTFDKLLDARSKMGSFDPKQQIRLKQQINEDLSSIETAIKELGELHQRDIKKKGDELGSKELSNRKAALETVVGEFHMIYKQAKGASHEGDVDSKRSSGMDVQSIDDLLTSKGGSSSVRKRREEMTGEQMQKLEQIRRVNQEQDDMLDEIGKGVDVLKDLADKMNDELQMQDEVLKDLDKKMDKSQQKLDAVNNRLKHALKSINDKSTNYCIYIILLVMIIGLASVAYNLAMK